MGKPLRALIVEDSLNDAELLIHELTSGGYDLTCERVETGDALRAALAREPRDIVLSDYSLPTFSGPDALPITQATQCDPPLIIVSGTIGQRTAGPGSQECAHD